MDHITIKIILTAKSYQNTSIIIFQFKSLILQKEIKAHGGL